MKNKPRYLKESLQSLAFDHHKMAFISGPRQSGKTTLSKFFIQKDPNVYYNWDDITFRRLWNKNPHTLIQDKLATNNAPSCLIFDEIHKAPKWKTTLKSLYDHYGKKCHIIVTGSTKLDIYKKGGDSLLGRYFNFRLHPFSYSELIKPEPNSPQNWLNQLKYPTHYQQTTLLNDLLTYGGFPEPFLSQNEKFCRVWRRTRVEKLIREDLRDLSKIIELGQLEITAALLSSKVGSPLSIQSLREDLEVSYDTMKRWLTYFKQLYYFFELKPWYKTVSRSLKKEGKHYMWDWTEVTEPGARFENLIASHLLKACHFWTDTGEGEFELFYVKNKEKQEIDFLIVKDKFPWLPIECKLEETALSSSFHKLLSQLNVSYFVQVVQKENICTPTQSNKTPGIILSADTFLSHLV